MFTQRPKSYRLTWILAGVILVLAISTAAYLLVLRTVQERALFLAGQQLEHQAQDHAEHLETLLTGNHNDLLTLSADTAIDNLRTAMERWYTGPRHPAIRGIFLFDQEGNVLLEQPTALLQSLGIPPHKLRPEDAWLERGQSTQLLRSTAGITSQQFVILREQGRWTGTLSILTDLTRFFARDNDTLPHNRQFLALLNEAGEILLGNQAIIGLRFNDLAPTGTDSFRDFLKALARNQVFSRSMAIPARLMPGADPEAKGTVEATISLAPVRLYGQSWGILYGRPLTQLQIPTATALGLHGCLTLIWVGAGLILWQARRNRHCFRILEQNLADISTEHQLSQERAEDLTGRNRQLLNNVNDAIFLVDPEDGTVLESNRFAEQLLGYSRGELNQLSLKVLCRGQHYRQALRLVNQVKKSGQAEDPELQLRRKDGSQFVSAIHARSSWLGNRNVVFCSLRDVTPSIKLALELRRHNRQLSLLNEIAHRVTECHDLMAVLDIILHEVIKNLNVAGGGIYLLKHQGTEMQLMIHHNIPEEVLTDLKQLQPDQGLAGKVATTGRPRLSTNLQNDHRRISKAVANDGWRAFLAVPLIADKTVHGVLFVFNRSDAVVGRDDVRLLQAIGRQVGPLVKNAELFDELQWQHRLNQATMRELERSRSSLRENLEQLEEHHRTLQSLEQMKSTFLALASHELRTPLTSIMSGSEFLEDSLQERLSNDEDRAMRAIRHGGQRLQQIIQDLLEAARLETQSLYLAKEPLNPQTILTYLETNYRERCQARRLDLSIGSFPDKLILRGDAFHLQKACGRLLENAIKFTPSDGWIKIGGRLLAGEAVLAMKEALSPFSRRFFEQPLQPHYLEITLRDSGIGIAPEERTRVFDKFYEVGSIESHSTSDERFGGKGVGLGLTLTKGIIEAHGGLIWVESSGENQGSCFSILLPVTDGADHVDPD